jgi:hypothetical protein
MSNFRLHVIEGDEKHIPLGGLQFDINYYDWDSLCRMYGEATVVDYLRGMYGSRWPLVREELGRYA